MERKSYLVGVQIIECRGIQAPKHGGKNDPFVRISCGNLPQQTTEQRWTSTNAVWNQSFSFADLEMNNYELESFELILQLFNYHTVYENEIIGQYSIGLSTMYRNANHEYYRTWVQLVDPAVDGNPNSVQGYLRFSAFIVGPGERPPVHGQEDALEDEDAKSDEEPLDQQQLLDFNIKMQGMRIVAIPRCHFRVYQLICKVYCGRDFVFDPLQGGKDIFITVRSQGLQRETKKALCKAKEFPFQSSFLFPVFLPTYNDKITMRLWQDVASGFGTVVNFMANIPEKPNDSDFANIASLIPMEGKMEPRWVNLYGIYHSEKQPNFPQGNSSFLGRLLMSLTISENDKPLFAIQTTVGQSEPETGKYILYMDAYEMVNCPDEYYDGDLSIFATIATKGTDKDKEKPEELKGKVNKTSGGTAETTIKKWTWSEKKFYQTKEIEYLPKDPEQCPDVIIYVRLKSKGMFAADKRVGFIRLQAKTVARNESKPNWYTVLSIENTTKIIGMLLLNVQLVLKPGENEPYPEHIPAKRGKQIPYFFFAQIISGFELAPHINEANLKSKCMVQIGNDSSIVTKSQPSRFPVYNRSPLSKTVTLDSNLSFCSDMRINVMNEQWSIWGNYDRKIGSFLIPVSSIKTCFSYPQFYNVVDDNGNMAGKILARFFLFLKPVGKTDDIEKKIREEMVKKLLVKSEKFDVTFSTLGLRNLVNNRNRVKIRVQLTNHLFTNKTPEGDTPAQDAAPAKEALEGITIISPYEPKCLDGKPSDGGYYPNVNIGQTIKFENIDMSTEPLLWPWLIVDEVDWGESTVYSRTLIPLFVYAKDVFSDPSKVMFTMALFKNQGTNQKISYFDEDQLSINPARHYYNLMLEKIMAMSGNLYQDVNIDSAVALLDTKQLEDEVEKHLERKKGFVDHTRKHWMMKLPIQGDVSEVNLGPGGTAQADICAYIETDNEEAHLIVEDTTAKTTGKVAADDGGYQKPIDYREIKHYRQEFEFDLQCTAEHKIKEKDFKEKMARKFGRLVEHLQTIQEEAAMMKLSVVKECARSEQTRLRRVEDEYAEGKQMNMEIFTFKNVDMDSQYDFGERAVLKTTNVEDNLAPAFKAYTMFTEQKGFFSSEPDFTFEFDDGIYRTGKNLGNSLRALVLVTRSADREAIAMENDGATPLQEDQTPTEDDDGEMKVELKVHQQVLERYKFDPMRELGVMNYLKVDNIEYKVRVYILTCQNLTATDSSVDLRLQIAGVVALSSADPYPVITVGSGRNLDATASTDKKVKFISDRENRKSGTLNPSFYRMYELNCILPQDSKLTVEIRDYGDLNIFRDEQIGQTVIDLESRRFGDAFFQARQLTEIKFDEVKQKIKDVTKQKPKDKAGILAKQKKMTDLVKERTQLENWAYTFKKERSNLPLQPCEFRELYQAGKDQAQGIIQMWVDILTEEESRLNPPVADFKAPLDNEEYEIRLIVWETRDIPLMTNGKVNQYVKASFLYDDPKEAPVVKKTDFHNASKDGKGMFNWRMKFAVSLPAEFPRILVQVFDAGFTSDTCQSETVINVKQAITLYRNKGKMEWTKVWASFNTPGNKDQEAGYVLISLQVLSKDEAGEEEVGEGQDEPNVSPTLVKPTEGRGYGDILSSLPGFTLPTIELPFVAMFKKIMILLIVVICLAAVGFLLWYTKK